MSFVREDGRELTDRRARLSRRRRHPHLSRARCVARDGYRPADEDRKRGCDMSTLINIKRHSACLRLAYRELDPRQIVDWKSPEENLNTYDDVVHRHRSRVRGRSFRACSRTSTPTRRSTRWRLTTRAMGGGTDAIERRVRPLPRRRQSRLPRPCARRASSRRGSTETPRPALSRAATSSSLRRVAPGLEPGTYTFPDGWLAQPQSRPPRRREAPLSLEEAR